MAKFKVGDEVAIAALVKITAIQPNNNDTVSYSTDRGISIHETLLDQIMIKPKEPKAEEPKPAPKPAHRFKVGDRVVTSYGVGYVKQVDNVNNDGMPYCIKYDFGCALWRGSGEAKAAPAPAPEPPKFYTGNVFAEKIIECDAREGMRNRIGRVFEIKNGIIQGDVKQYDLDDYDPIISFSDFCLKAKSTKWHEVKSDV